MAKTFLIVFLILFAGRIILRYILQRLNIKHLKTCGKAIPPVFTGEIDEATLSRIVDYTYDSSRIAWKENLFDDIVELAILFLLVPVMVDRLTGSGIHVILQALIFFGILAAVTGLAGLPFDIYDTFVLEKRYGFSTITWKIWITDLIKSLIISTILMAIMITAFMTFVYRLPESWWFWAWVFFTAFEVVLLWLYPVLIAPLFNKYEPIRDELLREQ
jgi:STE24 endopeptidase